MNPDWTDEFLAVESYLREHTDAKTDTPAALPIPANEPADPAKWQAIIAALTERGWRTAVGDGLELWFFAPGPLTDPGDVARSLN